MEDNLLNFLFQGEKHLILKHFSPLSVGSLKCEMDL